MSDADHEEFCRILTDACQRIYGAAPGPAFPPGRGPENNWGADWSREKKADKEKERGGEGGTAAPSRAERCPSRPGPAMAGLPATVAAPPAVPA